MKSRGRRTQDSSGPMDRRPTSRLRSPAGRQNQSWLRYGIAWSVMTATVALSLVGCTSRTDGTPITSTNRTMSTAASPTPTVTSTITTTTTATSKADLDGNSQWVGELDGVVVYLQWVRAGDKLTGAMTGTRVESGTLKSDTVQFTGVVSGTSLVLNVTGTDQTVETVSGEISAGTLRLSGPNQDGTFTGLVLTSGTLADYNSAVALLRSGTSGKVFDASRVAVGVAGILTAAPPGGYGVADVSAVYCPTQQPVKAGTSFSCTAIVAGSTKSVTVNVTDDNGKYTVTPPR